MSVSDSALQFPADAVERRMSKVLIRLVRALAFWTAVVLPVAYLPLLASGLDSVQTAVTFATVISAHVCALVLGKHYGRRA